MTDRVTMHHPNLPGQPITVPASAVEHRRKAGWTTTAPETDLDLADQDEDNPDDEETEK